MSEPKWPSGPWSAIEHGEPGSGWWTVLLGAWDVSGNRAAEPGVVADSRYSAMTPEENKAAAHLIARSPRLYTALEKAAEEAEAMLNEGVDDLRRRLSVHMLIAEWRRELAAARGEAPDAE